MGDFYFLKCIDFDSIAQNSYAQYLSFSKQYKALGNDLDVLEVPQAVVNYISAYKNMESAAYMAIVFEALAVEAYVNTLGEHLIGERYYQEYESKDAKKDRTTLGKLKRLCKNEIGRPYPTDGVHFRAIQTLLNKRDAIVHTKPVRFAISKCDYDYADSAASFRDIIEAFSGQVGFLFENIEQDMACYRELDANMCELLGYSVLNRIISGMCGFGEIEQVRRALPDWFWQLIANMISSESGL